ncbi:MAG: hypothetical protein D6731_17915 [Planctomycetota bacterium]|nr:MAG: hypothetical protein D6731_17915 [Planctomycetota bacterium]
MFTNWTSWLLRLGCVATLLCACLGCPPSGRTGPEPAGGGSPPSDPRPAADSGASRSDAEEESVDDSPAEGADEAGTTETEEDPPTSADEDGGE